MIKIRNFRKLSTRLPVLLRQIKAENNSWNLKKNRQILYLLHQLNEITKKPSQQLNQVIMIMGDNKLVITKESKLFILIYLNMLALI